MVVDVDGKFARGVDGTEDGEKLQWDGAGIDGGVGCVFGDVGHFAGVEGAFLAIDPLVGDAFEDVDDFFAAGMGVEFVSPARFEGGADEEDVFGADDFRIGHPFDMAPGHIAVLEVFGGDEVGWHGASLQWGRVREKAICEKAASPLSRGGIQR